jgi:predicted nucleotidyltransferase
VLIHVNGIDIIKQLFEKIMKTLDSINLVEKDRNSVMQAARSLKSELPVSKVILFGSKARGQGDVYSDIDILVITSCPITTNLRGIVSEKLAEINLQNDVVLSSVVVFEKDWADGLIRYMPIYTEVQRDGCEV